MAPKNVTVTLEDVDEQAGTMFVRVGSFAHPVFISRFKNLIRGTAHEPDIEHLLHNMAIRASLANADINDINSIKAAVEGVPFKV